MEKFRRKEVLGQGTYGKVYKARNVETGQTVALKKTLLTSDDEGVPPTTLREVSILRSLKSPYVIRLEDVIQTEDSNKRALLYLVFEYLDHDLKQFMNKKYGRANGIDPMLAKHWCYQILLGLKYCHSHSVMHRDLKPQNLLVDLESCTIKLADFGLGRVFSVPVARYTHEVVTLWYRAPEILLGTRLYSTGVDIWSVGCILGEMITGRPLFCGESEIEQLLSIFRILGTPTADTWPDVGQLRDWHAYPQWRSQRLDKVFKDLQVLGEDGMELLISMLQLAPEKRVSARDALKSPYFDDIRDTYADDKHGTIEYSIGKENAKLGNYYR